MKLTTTKIYGSLLMKVIEAKRAGDKKLENEVKILIDDIRVLSDSCTIPVKTMESISELLGCTQDVIDYVEV